MLAVVDQEIAGGAATRHGGVSAAACPDSCRNGQILYKRAFPLRLEADRGLRLHYPRTATERRFPTSSPSVFS